MKKSALIYALVLPFFMLSIPLAQSEDMPAPFGFVVDQTSYSEALNILKKRNWEYKEYDKKQFKQLGKNAPERGKNTFVVAKTKTLEGVRGIRLFFNGSAVLDAVMLNLYPNMFPVVMEELDTKYKIVKKHLSGENYTTNYTHVLYKKENLYIELQHPGPHNVRLLYVSQLLYENYRDFLIKTYESFRLRQHKADWVKEL